MLHQVILIAETGNDFQISIAELNFCFSFKLNKQDNIVFLLKTDYICIFSDIEATITFNFEFKITDLNTQSQLAEIPGKRPHALFSH